jgi:hypothetical protein
MTDSKFDVTDKNALSLFDREILRLGSLEFSQLMNLRDNVVHEYEDGGQIRISFHRYGQANAAPEDGPITTGFRIFAGNQSAEIGKDPSYAGTLEYRLQYARRTPMSIATRTVEITQDWFLTWLQSNLAGAVTNVISTNAIYWNVERDFQESEPRRKEIESKTIYRDAIGWIVGAIVGGTGIDALFGIGFLTAFGALFSGYAGLLFARNTVPVPGEEQKKDL